MHSSTELKITPEILDNAVRVLRGRTRMSLGDFAVQVKLPRSFVEKTNLMGKAREHRKNLDATSRKTQAEDLNARREKQRVEQAQREAAEFAGASAEAYAKKGYEVYAKKGKEKIRLTPAVETEVKTKVSRKRRK